MRPAARAFTLVEVLVAAGILAMFFVPMLANMVSLRRQGYESRNLVVATNLAQATVESLKTLSRRRFARPNPGTTPLQFPPELCADVTDGNTTFKRTPFANDIAVAGRLVGTRLGVRVSWPMPGRTGSHHQLALATLFFADGR